jgi:hypothetical protein
MIRHRLVSLSFLAPSSLYFLFANFYILGGQLTSGRFFSIKAARKTDETTISILSVYSAYIFLEKGQYALFFEQFSILVLPLRTNTSAEPVYGLYGDDLTIYRPQTKKRGANENSYTIR